MSSNTAMCTSALNTTPKKTFTCFSKLPQEIREEIWTICYSSSPTRVLQVGIEPYTRQNDTKTHFTISGGGEPLFLTCTESHRLVVKKREAITGFKIEGCEFKNDTIRFRPETDILFISSDRSNNLKWPYGGGKRLRGSHIFYILQGLSASSLRTCVKSITIDYDIWNLYDRHEGFLVSKLTGWSKLRLINLAVMATPNPRDASMVNSSQSGGENEVLPRFVCVPPTTSYVTEDSRRRWVDQVHRRAMERVDALAGDPHATWISVPQVKLKVFVKGETALRSIEEWIHYKYY